MPYIPQIKIKKSTVAGETRLFLKFLNHPDFPRHRRLILKAHPNLKLPAIHGKEREAVHEYLKSEYAVNRAAICRFSNEAKKILNQVPSLLSVLGKAMSYGWKKGTIYFATPTLLPFSPFGRDRFYFSILGQIRNRSASHLLLIAIHEISHFIFLEMLGKFEALEKFRLGNPARHYLQESFTAALFNEGPLRGKLNIKNHLGNLEIREIEIALANGKILSLVEWIRKKYRANRHAKRNFSELVESLIRQFHATENQWSKKWDMWNIHGSWTDASASIPKAYHTPISLIGDKKGGRLLV